MSRPARPVFLFVFANPRRDLALNRETSGIRAALRSRRDIELVVLDHPALAEIEDAFQERRHQIVAFHYSGHANGFQQMLESESGAEQKIQVAGFAQFLASQESLRFIFLNGCSTGGQVDDFFAAGVPCVLATTQDVADERATTFSLRFYSGLASGADLRTAYQEAVGSAKAQDNRLVLTDHSETRGIRVGLKRETPSPAFPWQLHLQDDQVAGWTLDEEVQRRRPQRETNNEVGQVQLQRLLNFVEEHWIRGILEQQNPSGLLEIGKTQRSDVINDPFEGIVEYASQQRETVGAEDSLLEIYQRVQKRLLLLGQPGSGKTTLLLQLGKELVGLAHRDPALPVPVVFSLSRWADPTQSFRDWLQSQLSDLYNVPRKLSGGWLDNHELILLLDGLDEVAAELRSECVQSINRYLDEVGVCGIVISSRIDEYTELPDRLRVAGALHLQPLTNAQIDGYLAAGGARLSSLRTMLEQNESLRTLAQSPLLLNIMSQVYDSAGNDSVANSKSDPQSQTADLFERFIERMFLRRGRAKPAFERAETEAGLKWLAQKMRESGSSLFLLEWIQPTWLTRGQQAIYCVLISAVLALCFGATLGVYWWGTSQISADTAIAIQHGLWWWPTALCFPWFLTACAVDRFLPNQAARGDWNLGKHAAQITIKTVIYMAMWLLLMLVPWAMAPAALQTQWMHLLLSGAVASLLLSAAGSHHRTMQEIHPAEAVTFSWRRAALSAPWGVIAGALLWLLFRAVWTEEPQIRFVFSNSEQNQGFTYMLVCLGVIGGISGAIIGAIKRAMLKTRRHPNQGIVNSRRNAVLIGCSSGVVLTAAVLGLMELQDLTGTQRTQFQLVLFSLGIGWAVVATAGSLFGGFDFIKHSAMRAILKATRSVPSPLERFLGYACELNFLKPVGGGFLFWHRLLLEHFADRQMNNLANKTDVTDS
jgi:hypothetical protein